MRSVRLKKEIRQGHILQVMAHLAHEGSYKQITQGEIARGANISRGSITYHFYDMDNLRRELMKFAIRTGDLKVLGQGIALGDPIALAAPESAKANALALLSNA